MLLSKEKVLQVLYRALTFSLGVDKNFHFFIEDICWADSPMPPPAVAADGITVGSPQDHRLSEYFTMSLPVSINAGLHEGEYVWDIPLEAVCAFMGSPSLFDTEFFNSPGMRTYEIALETAVCWQE